MKKNRLPYLIFSILFVWCLVLSFVTYNNNKNKQTEVVNEYNVAGFSTDFTQVVEDNKSAIVSINCSGTISSGFVYKQIDNKIYILTSYHGVTGNYINVFFDNDYSAYGTLVGKDVYLDLAVISVDSEYSINPLSLGDSSVLKNGEFIISIGTPISLDYSSSVEMGLISNNTRVIENSIKVDGNSNVYYLDVIQLSSNLKPGYSGSPVLNMNGEVVGMTTMSLDDDINFAITSNEIRIVADNIIASNEYVKYQTGLKGSFVSNMPTYVKSNLNLPIDLLNGYYVEKVMNNSIAILAGIQVGDVVTSINGTDINDLNSYLNVLYTKADVLEFKVLRNSNTLTLMVHIND